MLAFVNQLSDRLAIDRDLGRIAMPAVDDRGNLPLRPQLAGHALAGFVAILHFQCDLSHRVAP